jgi:hypothetical protein
MTDEKQKVPVKGARQERLKQALRENLKRRKAQARERQHGETAAPSNLHEAERDDTGDSRLDCAGPGRGEC